MASKEDVYGAFVDYYGDLALGLIKDENGWAVYAAKVYSGLNLYRYIFVIVPSQSLGSSRDKTTLDQLDWISFQTRTTDEVHKVPTHHLYLDDKRKKLFSDKITAIERISEETHYITDSLPIKIRLLHDPKKKNHLQYPDQAFMYQALDTYRCVVELL
uniref:Uncharacterized protein n=1 Tax=Marseillevirus LCMAC201 TaxID=2506605 RepID=A0A481YWC7_9VIRU|nr:MAG: uncharacterized protein LCMAC201_01030 [Marseillevirus LCMAC201]